MQSSAHGSACLALTSAVLMPVNNQIWALALTAKFYSSGVRHFCIAPGSRSAPLAIALHALQQRYPEITLHTHYDERGLAFFALSISKTSEAPVVIVTTSGTAVANLYPAVIEAYETECPLVVLTADRPNRLLNCGANQAVQQKHIFGKNVQAYNNVQLPLHTNDLRKQLNLISTLFNTETKTSEAMATQHRNSIRGPVHFNCQFDEPLYAAVTLAQQNEILAFVAEHTAGIDTAVTSAGVTSAGKKGTENTDPKIHKNPTNMGAAPTAAKTTASAENGAARFVHLTKAILRSNHCLLVVGSLTQQQKQILLPWFKEIRCPIVADINSQIKFEGAEHIIRHFELMLAHGASKNMLTPDLIVQIGARIVSKRVNTLLDSFNAETFLIQDTDKSIDPTHRALKIVTTFSEFVKNVNPAELVNHKLAKIIAFNTRIESLLQRYFLTVWNEASVCRELLAALPSSSNIFCGNSLAIRMLDSYCSEGEPDLSFHSNRGASGIDGIIASAAGVSAHYSRKSNVDSTYQKKTTKHVFLFIGDTSYLHDLNSLALVAKSATPIKIIILNNDGGAIFKMLPAGDEPSYRELFQMPHGLSFEASAQQFGLNYLCCTSLAQFKNNIESIINASSSLVVECKLSADSGVENIKALLKHLNATPGVM